MMYKSYDDLPIVLSVEQLMDVLDIGRTKTYELIRCGTIKSVRVGHKIRIPKDSVISYLSNR